MANSRNPKAFNRFSTSRKVVKPEEKTPSQVTALSQSPSVESRGDVLPPPGPVPTVSDDVRLPPTLTSSTTPPPGALISAADRMERAQGTVSGYSGDPARTAREAYLSQGGAFVGGEQIGSASFADKARVAEDRKRKAEEEQARRTTAATGYYKDSSGRTVYRDSEGNTYLTSDPNYYTALEKDKAAGIEVSGDIKPGLPPAKEPTAAQQPAVLAGTEGAAAGPRTGTAAAQSSTVGTSQQGLAVGTSRQGLGEGKDTSNYGFGKGASVKQMSPAELSDFIKAGRSEFAQETGLWSLEDKPGVARDYNAMREADPERLKRWMLVRDAIHYSDKLGEQTTSLPQAAGVQSRMGDGTPASVDMRTEYSWEGKSATAIKNDLLDMGGGQLRLDSTKNGIYVVDGQRVVNVVPSEAARALNAMPEDIRRDVLTLLLEEGRLDYILNADPETGVGSVLGNDWNRAIKGTINQLRSEYDGGYVNPSSPEAFILDKMLSSGEYRVEGDNIYEKGPHGEWVDMGPKASVVGEIRGLVQAYTEKDGSFDSASFINESDARYNQAVISGLEEYQASDIPEATRLASTRAVTEGGTAGGTGSINEVQQAWQGTVEKLQNLPLMDAEEVITANRNYYAMQNAKAMRLNMNRMARGGASPEAIQGTTAELDAQNRAAMAQQEAAVRMQTELTNLEIQQKALMAEMQMYSTIYTTSAEAEMREQALEAQQRLAALNNQAMARAERVRMDFEMMMSQGPGFGTQLLQGVIGVAGTVLGPWTGGASVAAAGLANAGISAAANSGGAPSGGYNNYVIPADLPPAPGTAVGSVYNNSPVKGSRGAVVPGTETLPAAQSDFYKYT